MFNLEKFGISHTLDDKIVLDSIRATNLLDESIEKYLNGGIAVHSYIPKTLHRDTSDVDFNTNTPLTFSEFKALARPVIKELKKLGYRVKIEKSRQTYDINVENEESGEVLQVQLARRTKNNYQKHKKILEREMANSNIQTRENVKFRVIKPEDLLLRKTSRIIVFEREYGVTPVPKENDLGAHLAYLKEARSRMFRLFDNMSSGELALYRIQADIFDTNALLANQSFDKPYFNEGFNLYDIFKADEVKSKKILELVNPRLVD